MTLLTFDILGRVTGHKQTTDGEEYETDYTYNLSGALVEQTYPSGRVVKNVLDNNGDLSMVQSRKNENFGYWAYANSFSYNAAGAVTSMQLGNGRWESTTFNSRLQPTQIALGTVQNGTDKLKLEHGYGTTSNNGNVLSQTITVPTVGVNPGFTAVQAYTYDSLNRISTAEETISSSQSWKQAFSYDRYGNRNFDEAETTTLPKNCGSSPNFTVCAADKKIVNPSINTANNRLSTSDDYVFDNSGNTTEDAHGRTFIYDAENKQVEVKDQYDNIVGEYRYDGDGRRVKKIVPSTGEVTVFVYSAGGQLVAEYSTVQPTAPKVSYTTTDHLGSPRILTDENGATISRRDFHPFGEEIATAERIGALGYQGDDVRQKFTGYERDNETDLDFAQARYYNSAHGRFIRPDPLLASGRIENPQTWNKYCYVLGNPLRFNDPLGLYEWDSTLGGELSDDELKARSKDKKKYNKQERKDYKRMREKRNLIRKSLAKAEKAANSKRLSDDQKAEVNKSLDAIGDEGEKNGVTIGIGQLNPGVGAQAQLTGYSRDGEGNVTGALIRITVSETASSSSLLAGSIAHEGYHAAQNQAAVAVWASTGNYVTAYNSPTNLSRYDTENQAYHVSAYVARGLGRSSLTFTPASGNSYTIWKRGMAEPDQRVLDALISDHYRVTPAAPNPRYLLPAPPSQ